jgi:hypothetical protein
MVILVWPQGKIRKTTIATNEDSPLGMMMMIDAEQKINNRR